MSEAAQDSAKRAAGADAAAAGGEWHIAQSAKRCSGCQAPFLPEHDYWSTIHVDTDGEHPSLARDDFCAACWKPSDERIYWKTRRRESEDDHNVVDIQAMHQLFLQLLEDEREEVEALRYVVGLMLVRKKVLKIIRNVPGARGDLVFKDPRDDKKRVRLPSPELSEETLERLKLQLGDILG